MRKAFRQFPLAAEAKIIKMHKNVLYAEVVE